MDRLRSVPVLAQIPGGAVARAADQAIDWPAAPFSQGVVALARQLADPYGPKVVAIASSQPGEDSSQIVAVGRAGGVADGGRRVVIVDANLRGADGGARVGHEPAVQAGLMEVLGGKALLSQALTRDLRARTLSCCSPAWAPRDPMGVVATRQMADLLTHLRRSCDLVLIDAPPVLTAAETRVLVQLSDAVALVVRNADDDTVDGAVEAARGTIPHLWRWSSRAELFVIYGQGWGVTNVPPERR